MKKKLLLFIFSLLFLNETFAQCGTTVTGNVISFCGPGCLGDVTFTSTGGTPPYDLQVNGNPTGQYSSSYNLTNLCPGSYTYVVTDASFSCSDTGVVTIVSNPLPPVAINPSNASICLGDSVLLTASGAATYSWSPIVAINTSAYVSPVATTVYTVVGADMNGCTNTATATVNVIPLPILFQPPPVDICYGSGATLTVSGASSYTWSPATGLSATTGSSVFANPLATTIYTIVGTSIQNCNNSATATINVHPLPEISFNITNESCVGCNDGSITVSSLTGSHFLWATGDTNTTISNLFSGTYPVNVWDIYGCTSNSWATVGVGTCNSNFIVQPDTLIPHTYWVINNATGASPISYLWTWGDATSDTTAFPTHTYATEGFYNICLSITDAAGCSCTNCWASQLARMDASNSMISVTVVSQIPTGQQGDDDSDFILYPNPAEDRFTMYDVRCTIEGAAVYSALGEKVFSQKPIANSQQQSLIIDVAGWSDGIYFIKVKTAEGEKIQKLMVQH